jgi:hypothetical protein
MPVENQLHNDPESEHEFDNEHSENELNKRYLLDPAILKRNKAIMNNNTVKKLIQKSEQYGSALVVLDDVVPDWKPPIIQRMREALSIFYSDDEFNSKEHYLQYLKMVYGFLISPLEEPPSKLMRTLYHSRFNGWEPEMNDAKILIKQFYLEAELIKNMSDSEWAAVRNSSNPEGTILRKLYGIQFSPEFKKLLSSIPWRISTVAHSAPALDLIWWRTPGPALARKPMGIDFSFIKQLVRTGNAGEAYRELNLENSDNKVKLRKTSQILRQIKQHERAIIDSYVGISRREADFVLHQRMIIWANPGFHQYQDSSKKQRLSLINPPKYLATLRERMIPLEVPFLGTIEFQNPNNPRHR